jgi:hypothetical protein
MVVRGFRDESDIMRMMCDANLSSAYALAQNVIDNLRYTAAVRANRCARIAIQRPSVAARPPIRNTDA